MVATSRRWTPRSRLRLGVKDALDVHVRVRRGHRPRLRVRIGVAEDGVSGRHLGLLRLRWGANFLLAVRFIVVCRGACSCERDARRGLDGAAAPRNGKKIAFRVSDRRPRPESRATRSL